MSSLRFSFPQEQPLAQLAWFISICTSREELFIDLDIVFIEIFFNGVSAFTSRLLILIVLQVTYVCATELDLSDLESLRSVLKYRQWTLRRSWFLLIKWIHFKDLVDLLEISGSNGYR